MEYVQEADEPLLQLMESLIESYLNESNPDSALTEEQWKVIDERWERHLTGESKSFTWEEVKENIYKARKNAEVPAPTTE